MEMVKEVKPEKETGRLEAFSDGVFAIAITLLILELKVPTLVSSEINSPNLAQGLIKQWPSYLSLTTSFFTILVMWVHHHFIFSQVRKSDAWLHFANGCLLLAVTFVPYPTSVLATYLETPAANAAAAFYAASFIVIAICFNLVLRAAFRRELLLPSTTDQLIAQSCRNYLFGPLFYAIAFVAAFFDVRICMGMCTALWIYWTATAMRHSRV
ncbi:MAG: TMEM175 family protein [Candidatus Acidiferrum sp.]